MIQYILIQRVSIQQKYQSGSQLGIVNNKKYNSNNNNTNIYYIQTRVNDNIQLVLIGLSSNSTFCNKMFLKKGLNSKCDFKDVKKKLSIKIV